MNLNEITNDFCDFVHLQIILNRVNNFNRYKKMGHHHCDSHDKKHKKYSEKTISSKKLAPKAITVNGVLLVENFTTSSNSQTITNNVKIFDSDIDMTGVEDINCNLSLLSNQNVNVELNVVKSFLSPGATAASGPTIMATSQIYVPAGYLTGMSVFWTGPVLAGNEISIIGNVSNSAATVSVVPNTFKLSEKLYSTPTY